MHNAFHAAAAAVLVYMLLWFIVSLVIKRNDVADVAWGGGFIVAAVASLVLDRSIYEDCFIFARALHHMGDVSERDYLAYRRLFELVVNSLPRPHLLIYLKAPVRVLMERICRRARNMETGITPEYLSLLDSFYDEWLGAFDMCPVLTIRTDDLDYVHQQQHLDTVIDRIQDKLAGKEVVEF